MTDTEDYKDVTKATYDAVAERYAERDKGAVDESDDVHAALDAFASLLPPAAKVLDIGCAAGRDASFLMQHGFRVTGIDFSSEMVERARRVVPEATFEVMDFERLTFVDEFDAVWANASLHHVPKKVRGGTRLGSSGTQAWRFLFHQGQTWRGGWNQAE